MSKREMPVWRNFVNLKLSEAHEYIAFKPGEILQFIGSLLQELEEKEKECNQLMKGCPGGRVCVNWPSRCFHCFRHPDNGDFLSEI